MTDLLDHPDAIALLRHAPQTTAFNKLRKRLNRLTREAIDTYGMQQDGQPAKPEKWLVCLSGGKDSWAMLGILMDLKAQGLLQADLLACNLDQGQPGFPSSTIPDFLNQHGITHRIEYRDTYSVVTEKVPAGKTYCSLCSRLRRGNLYRIAREEGCTSVVLGHHREDALETFLLNLFHGGTLAAMPPKLLNDEGDLTVLRPLALCAEDDLAKYAAALSFPIIPCDLCGSQDGLQRQAMKQLLDEWERKSPGRKETIFRALSHVKPGHMLDPALFDFSGLDPRN
ncbi:tRNA 2-thiocytidine(32) synthetase TtcA [Parvularcula flava]|uniref:tRNA-cytidine(32) 2-sulfurtransferase n=1 Tax=Aquisalinus luteolus TaxID=1566827 RepID=A0A8J3A983_9PROT|nr:tRNA 2-thiocytidine(32) synthetase TtcA [Aquisalinus luteolus]NHK28611.1 tRNA 2-thiocytidine(32) synthetase TtcA [Aquisalinus luteolus]GGH98997.1 tRNA 2-thiocytidine biosynthesis protein TtcA [Aquisalinus luteolus]